MDVRVQYMYRKELRYIRIANQLNQTREPRLSPLGLVGWAVWLRLNAVSALFSSQLVLHGTCTCIYSSSACANMAFCNLAQRTHDQTLSNKIVGTHMDGRTLRCHHHQAAHQKLWVQGDLQIPCWVLEHCLDRDGIWSLARGLEACLGRHTRRCSPKVRVDRWQGC
jgi:hypothetical protein